MNTFNVHYQVSVMCERMSKMVSCLKVAGVSLKREIDTFSPGGVPSLDFDVNYGGSCAERLLNLGSIMHPLGTNMKAFINVLLQPLRADAGNRAAGFSPRQAEAFPTKGRTNWALTNHFGWAVMVKRIQD